MVYSPLLASVDHLLVANNGIEALKLEVLLEPVDEVVGLGVHPVVLFRRRRPPHHSLLLLRLLRRRQRLRACRLLYLLHFDHLLRHTTPQVVLLRPLHLLGDVALRLRGEEGGDGAGLLGPLPEEVAERLKAGEDGGGAGEVVAAAAVWLAGAAGEVGGEEDGADDDVDDDEEHGGCAPAGHGRPYRRQ